MMPSASRPKVAAVPIKDTFKRWLYAHIEMMSAQRSSRSAKVAAYTFAVGSIMTALTARELIGPADIGLQFVTFFPAVALTAIYGGFWPGMLTMAISAILATFLYMPPYGALSFDFDQATLLSNLAFFLDELMVCGAIQAMHNHYRNFRATNEQLLENRHLLSAIIEGSTDAIFLKDTAGRYLHCNAAHLHMLGKKPDEIVGHDAFSVFPAEQARKIAEDEARIIASGKITPYEEVIKLPSGKERYFHTTKGPIFDNGGKVKGLFGIARDITDQNQAEKALKAAKIEAEKANKAKSRFLAAASHDLRQPLTALNLYIGALWNKLTPADSKLLENMNYCVDNLSEMLSDLLDLSKLEAGVVTPYINDFTLASIIAKAVSSHAPGAKLKGLELRHRDSKLIGRTDPMLFQRIVGNLVSNAIRYTGQGGVLIGCRRRQGKMWLEVWDTGIGIPEDKIDEIFEEFKQLGNSKRQQSTGSGLGLAIVAKTASLLGLQIRVRSRLGKGSVFAVELPLGETVISEVQSRPAHRSLRIALVEDNAHVAAALTYALMLAGHQVIPAISSSELLLLLDGVSPDIVISDYNLAETENGVDIITAMRANFGANLPAIIITGDTDPKLDNRMSQKNIRLQHKPLNIEIMLSAIGELTA